MVTKMVCYGMPLSIINLKCYLSKSLEFDVTLKKINMCLSLCRGLEWLYANN